jgi:hypothetical protein
MNKNISIIIPFNENFESLEKVLKNLILGCTIPDEIIIVDTSVINLEEKQQSICKQFNIVKFIKAPGAFPGEARNIGIDKSKYNLVGFLDIRTIPPLNWLSSSLKLIELNPSISGVYGKTEYFTSHEKSKLIKYSTYGMNPLVTVPGTLIKRTAINKIGNFIPNTRAGEDADWMMRLSLQKISMIKSDQVITYYGLDEFGFIFLIHKWFRNYKYSSNLPYLKAHKNIYYHSFVLFILIIAFNWNWLVADWNSESIFYIPHITKISILMLFSAYSIIRGLIIPCKKGVEFNSLIPFRWFFITLISLSLDLAKLCGFFFGSIYRK